MFTVQARGLGGALHGEQARRKTIAALTTKARHWAVVGGRVFGYHNVDVRNGDGKRERVERQIAEAEAAVVRDICQRYAKGEGLKQIARALNQVGALCPRAQRGRKSGWAPSTVREILRRPLY